MTLPEYVYAVYSGGNGVTDEFSLVSLPGMILIGFTTGILSTQDYLWAGEFIPLSTILPGQRTPYHRYDRAL